MTRASIALVVVILIACLTLVWVAMPEIRADIPVWIIIDALVAQAVIATGLTRVIKP